MGYDAFKAQIRQSIIQLAQQNCLTKAEIGSLYGLCPRCGTDGIVWTSMPESAFYFAECSIKRAINAGNVDELVSAIQVAVSRNALSYMAILNLINQGETKDLQKCEGQIKSDPRICSFIMHGDFEFRPVPVETKAAPISFKAYMERNSKCLENEKSFELCKENFCDLTQQCVGKDLPIFADFQDSEL